MFLKREIIPMLLKRCLPYVTSSSRLDMQCQENGRRTMSRSAQILRGLFGFKVKSLYKKSLGSSVDYQGYCFGVFGRYSNNTVPGPQQSKLVSTSQATVMTLPPYKIRGILRLKIQPRRGLCRNLTVGIIKYE